MMKRSIFVSLFLLAVVFLVAPGYAIDAGTAAGIWLLDEGSGEVAVDSSGNGNDGALIDGPGWVDGVFGEGLEFSGGNSVEVPDSASLNFGESSFSVVFWFNFSQAQDWNRLVRKRTPSPWGSGNAGWETQTHGTNIHITVDDPAGTTKRLDYEGAGDGVWHHLAQIIDRDSQLMISYLDGGNEQSIDISDVGSVTSDLPVVFAGGYTGTLDDIGIFNVALALTTSTRL